MSLPVDEWDWVAGGVEFGRMTPLWCYSYRHKLWDCCKCKS